MPGIPTSCSTWSGRWSSATTPPPPTAGSSCAATTTDAPEQRHFRYDRDQLLIRNQIDLNAFVHRRRLYDQLGGFDERLTRLVDWDLILRYTRLYPPVEVPTSSSTTTPGSGATA